LKGDPWLDLLGQLQGLLELAAEEDGEVRVIGD
jgi:hypothetical protein